MDFLNNVGGDPLKPSLFELVAQEQLRDLLQPALKYVLAVSLVYTLWRFYIAKRIPLGLCATISSLPIARREPTRRVLCNDHVLCREALSPEAWCVAYSSCLGEIGSCLLPGASFAENFYGLKRRRTQYIKTNRAQAAVGGVPSGEALRKQEIWRSLVFLVCCLVSYYIVDAKLCLH
jgi:hypothetical protein